MNTPGTGTNIQQTCGILTTFVGIATLIVGVRHLYQKEMEKRRNSPRQCDQCKKHLLSATLTLFAPCKHRFCNVCYYKLLVPYLKNDHDVLRHVLLQCNLCQ